jgi:hypothetical protein
MRGDQLCVIPETDAEPGARRSAELVGPAAYTAVMIPA